MNSTISLMRLRFEKATEEYYNSEDYKCKCPRCLSTKSLSKLSRQSWKSNLLSLGYFLLARQNILKRINV
jgi:hypothetical protein